MYCISPGYRLNILLSGMRQEISKTKQLKKQKQKHIFTTFLPIFCIFLGNVFPIFDELLSFILKIFSPNNIFRVKKGNIGDLPEFDLFRPGISASHVHFGDFNL